MHVIIRPEVGPDYEFPDELTLTALGILIVLEPHRRSGMLVSQLMANQDDPEEVLEALDELEEAGFITWTGPRENLEVPSE